MMTNLLPVRCRWVHSLIPPGVTSPPVVPRGGRAEGVFGVELLLLIFLPHRLLLNLTKSINFVLLLGRCNLRILGLPIQIILLDHVSIFLRPLRKLLVVTIERDLGCRKLVT